MKEEEVDWTAPLSPRNRNARSGRFDRLGATYCQGRANGMDHADLPNKKRSRKASWAKRKKRSAKSVVTFEGRVFGPGEGKDGGCRLILITREPGVRTPWRGSDQFESSVEAAP